MDDTSAHMADVSSMISCSQRYMYERRKQADQLYNRRAYMENYS